MCGIMGYIGEQEASRILVIFATLILPTGFEWIRADSSGFELAQIHQNQDQTFIAKV